MCAGDGGGNWADAAINLLRLCMSLLVSSLGVGSEDPLGRGSGTLDGSWTLGGSGTLARKEKP